MTTWEAYRGIDAVNVSSLLHLEKSPAHYQHVLQAGDKETAALLFGRLAHVAILEPTRYETEVAVWKGGVRRGKEWESWQLANAGKLHLTLDEHRACLAMQVAVLQHPAAGPYLEQGLAEHTVVWKHAGSGIQCKSRLDWVDLDNNVIVDLKTTRDASPIEFGKAAARLRYHTRAAFYADAYATKYGDAPTFVLLAVEKEEPYAVAVYNVPEDQLDAGRREYEGLLDRLKRCRDNKTWPGIADDRETDLLLPSWAFVPDDGLDVVFNHEESTHVAG